MTNLEHAAAERAKLYSERNYWEGVRRNANFELQDAARDNGAYTNNIEEQLKAQLAMAIYQLDRIAQELNRLEREREAQAREDAFKQETQRENALKEAERREQDAGQKERELKEEFAKEERLKAQAQQKEEHQKAEALEKERQEKEFLDKQERERQEALLKEEREKQELEKQELEKQEALKKEEMQQKERPELDDLAAQIADLNAEFDYVDQQIQEEMEYNVAQALEAVAEAGFEIGIAIADPISQKEAGQYLEDRKQALKDFISDEVFQAAPAENKEQWLEAKFKEQQQALEQEFGDRKDDWGNLKQMQDGLADLQKALLDTVKREQEIQDKLNDQIEELKRVEAETKERMEKANLEKEVLEEKTRQAEELARKLEEQLREQAERERQAIWDREQRLLQEIEAQRREEAAREEARRREDAARTMQDAFS